MPGKGCMSMGDLISRTDAIEALEHTGLADDPCDTAIRVIEALPAVKPEKPDHGYMWMCPECGLEVHSDFESCVRCGWERTEQETAKRVVSRGGMTMWYQCSVCHEPVDAKDRYCSGCGRRLLDE